MASVHMLNRRAKTRKHETVCAKRSPMLGKGKRGYSASTKTSPDSYRTDELSELTGNAHQLTRRHHSRRFEQKRRPFLENENCIDTTHAMVDRLSIARMYHG